jgi:hypothetical protein
LNVVTLPPSLDHKTVDDFLDAVWQTADGKLLLDARHLRWIDPHGMVALLGAGAAWREKRGGDVRLQLPENAEVPGYLARMGFFAEADRIFEMDHRPPNRASGDSDVLLEITSVATNSDVHGVVDRVQSAAGRVLSRS